MFGTLYSYGEPFLGGEGRFVLSSSPGPSRPVKWVLSVNKEPELQGKQLRRGHRAVISGQHWKEERLILS